MIVILLFAQQMMKCGCDMFLIIYLSK